MRPSPPLAPPPLCCLAAAQRIKQHLQVENNDLKSEREGLLAEVRSLRDGIRGPTNPEALEERIAALEFKLNHESLSVAGERRGPGGGQG